MMVNRSRTASGFTLVEVTIILLVLVILSAILLPTIERFIDLARVVKAKEDVGAIATAIALFLYDTGLPCFLIDGGYAAGGGVGSPPSYNDSNRVDVIYSVGATPRLDVVGAPILCSGTDFWGWQANAPGIFGPIQADTMENQLVRGNPLGDGPVMGFVYDPNDYYLRPRGHMYPGFRGAYLSTPIGPDPWGNRYSANVGFLHTQGTPAASLYGCGHSVSQFLDHDVFVLSAGPDGTINTSFSMDGGTAQLDDIMALVGGRGNGMEQ